MQENVSIYVNFANSREKKKTYLIPLFILPNFPIPTKTKVERMDPPDLRSLFRSFFGYSSDRDIPMMRPPYQDDHDDDEDSGYRDRSAHGDINPRGFSVFSDPLEMSRFFDQQMDEMLRMFGGNLGLGGGAPNMIPWEPESETRDHSSPGHARDFMLKDDGQPRVDSEVEWDKLDMDELDQLMTKKKTREDSPRDRMSVFDLFPGLGHPHHHHHPGNFDSQPPAVRSFGFGSSFSEKTTRNSNGGIETVKTQRYTVLLSGDL